MANKKSDDRTKILVVGDWLVDEYWLLGEQRSSFSRRRGQRHALALHVPQASVRTLGGAGMVAAVLAQMQVASGKGAFQVHGLGRWHPDDTDAIRHLVFAADHEEQTHFRLTFPNKVGSTKDVVLHNLPALPQGNATTRVIRLYHRTGSDLELLQRVDWELETAAPGRHESPSDRLPKSLNEKFRHVVFLDLLKGVVTPSLAQSVLAHSPDAAWYVFSKAYRPEWLVSSGPIKDRVRLLFVPQTAATQAMSDAESPGWITARGEPSRDAVNVLRQLQAEFRHAHVLVMPRKFRLLLGLDRDRDTAFKQPDESLPRHGDLIPLATVMFPTLIAHQVSVPLASNHKRHPEGSGFRDLVERSLAFTYHWMENEANRFGEPGFRPTSRQVCRIEKLHTGCVGPTKPVWLCKPRELQPFSLNKTSQEWEQAFQGRGIITSGGPGPMTRKFQVWRAMTDIDDYVACVPHKRRILQTLVKITQDFKSQNHRRHTSVLLIDHPGSGKSYLVECLARELSIRRLEFNITQLLDRTDLLHCFDTIVTTQSQSPNDPLLVFFDEINAKLDGNHVYDSFLAPLEQGAYVRSGNRFHIQPCLWIFAGTQDPRQTTGNTSDAFDQSDKMSDFVSRLSHHPFDLSSADMQRGKHDQELEKLEQIYVAMASLRSVFGDVTHVSEAIFEIFDSLEPKMGPRAIRQFVRRFQDVQRGCVTIQNLPSIWREHTEYTQEEAELFMKRWRHQEPNLVSIEF